MICRAIKFNRTSVLYVPRRIIPEHTRTDVLEVRICRVEAGNILEGHPYFLYAFHNPGYRRAFLSLFQLRPKAGESFAVLDVRKYGLTEFVNDYNASKPMGFEETELILQTNLKLTIRIGPLLVPLRFDLGSYRGQVHLDASLTANPYGQLRITKSLSSFRVSLKQGHRPITSIDSDSGRLLISYRSTHMPRKDHVRVSEEKSAKEIWRLDARIVVCPAHYARLYEAEGRELPPFNHTRPYNCVCCVLERKNYEFLGSSQTGLL